MSLNFNAQFILSGLQTTMQSGQNLSQHLGLLPGSKKLTNGVINSFQALLKEPNKLNEAIDYLYDALLDDATTGICMEIHQQHKTGTLAAMEGVAEEPSGICGMPNYDIFGMSTENKPINCCCPNCDKMVAAARFAPHLHNCLGFGRSSSRSATRRRNSFGSSNVDFDHGNASDGGTDDKDDADWSLKKPKKIQKTSRFARVSKKH